MGDAVTGRDGVEEEAMRRIKPSIRYGKGYELKKAVNSVLNDSDFVGAFHVISSVVDRSLNVTYRRMGDQIVPFIGGEETSPLLCMRYIPVTPPRPTGARITIIDDEPERWTYEHGARIVCMATHFTELG